MATHVIIGAGMIVTFVLSLCLLGYCLRYDDKRGAVPLAVMFTGIACWVLADTMHVLLVETNGDPMAGGGLLIRVFGIELTVIGFLLLGLSYTGREHLVSVRTLAVLLIKPAVMLAVILSPFRTAVFSTVAASVPLGYELQLTGPFLAHILYSYGIAFAGILLLGSVMVRSPSRYRLQSLALFLAVTIPFSVSVLFQIGIIPFDITPVSFMASGLLLTAGVFRLRLLDTIPIARQRVLDEMDDPVVVLDEQARIVMSNAAAADRLSESGSLIGRSGPAVFGEETLSRLESTGQADCWVETATGRRHFSVTASTVGSHQAASLATVVVCRDVTEQQRRQQQLRSRESELSLLKDLQSRVLRHNLRNELNVIRTNAELLADDDSRAAYEELMEKTDRLLDWTEKARRIERLIEAEQPTQSSLSDSVEPVLADARERYPDVTFEADLDGALSVIAVAQIDRAIKDLIDNAAEHNTAADPVVTVRTAADGDWATLTVEDNGPGIDDDIVDAVLDGDRVTPEEGVGLGVWIVYWVAEKSGGDLRFETCDAGTTVELRFERAGVDDSADREPPMPDR
ncbi:histidine kinase N-terminal 7TM domain-containing protein [Halovenus sp. HT40]|uniref:histidine kinase N-terminal 7TM domain-containing protein n=1 Tax=Halovenus sp. HT40 TaxID=3126691 RepID=UPI00300F450B